MNSFFGGLIALFTSVTLTLAPTQQESPELMALRSFLGEKKSPIPAEVLMEYPNWKTVLALSCAESGYGNHLAGTYNAWGIKDFQLGSSRYGGTRDFASWDESIKYVSDLLYKYDPANGTPSPKVMVATWKYVRPYAHWINNVAYSLYDIEQNVQVA